MTGPRRNEARREKRSGLIQGTGGGYCRDDGWPEGQAKRSVSVRDNFLVTGNKFGDRIEQKLGRQPFWRKLNNR